ncbi:MAG: GNAT family N-acetyltransferase [Clostridiales bacterium]|nr:GNAT family N-acetyltransferase [Clostridiales bacterium]
MKLRKLELKDAPLMLEWMHDESVVKDLQADFAAKTLEDCENFIKAAADTSVNMHLAITDDNDEYMGTVSLKHINGETAEFGITVRTAAMGKGYSRFAMEEIIKTGLDKLGLKSIFWCVNPENKRAVRFYDKNGYRFIDMKNRSVEGYTKEQVNKYVWYEVRKHPS